MFVCLCLNAAALRQHRSIPHCAPLIVSDRLLSSPRLALGCSSARDSKTGLSPRLKIAGLRMRTGGFPTYIAPCFSFRLCPVSSPKSVSRATSCHLGEGRPKNRPIYQDLNKLLSRLINKYISSLSHPQSIQRPSAPIRLRW